MFCCCCEGRAGWGIGWYINDTLIPTLVLQRGKTYTFVVYGGDDPDFSSRYHPFYITSSESGGILLETEDTIVRIPDALWIDTYSLGYGNWWILACASAPKNQKESKIKSRH